MKLSTRKPSDELVIELQEDGTDVNIRINDSLVGFFYVEGIIAN